MSLLKAFKGWREFLRLTVFRKGPKVYISKTKTLQHNVKDHVNCYESWNPTKSKDASSLLRSVLSRSSGLLSRYILVLKQPRYTGLNKLRNVPLISLIGLNLGVDDQVEVFTNKCMETTVSAVRNVFKDYKWEPEQLENNPQSLEDLDINETAVIGNGCEGAVFEAKLKALDAVNDSPEEYQKDYNLAIKAVFNYGVESNASSILRELNREIVPLQPSEHTQNQLDDIVDTNVFRLSPHPNIVDMHSVFIDDMLVTDQGRKEFPAAMPTRLNPEGCFGRNKTLYLVMRKCTTKLSEFLSPEVSIKTRCLLLGQLLEAMNHITSQGVAHRDVKADNILIDVPENGGTPRLQICDFGCCLAEESKSLEIPFVSDDVNLGGNSWLMAPEISCARPGKESILDFRKSDLWACGAIAYEILGAENPFYPNSRKQLKSRTYSEDELPPLPDNVPTPIKKLVKSLLARDPAKRPVASVAVLVVQMVIWESTSKQRHTASRRQNQKVISTGGNKMSTYLHYRNKERQKIGLVLGEMFQLIKRIMSEVTLVKQDMVEISKLLCLSRLTQSDFIEALKFFY